MVLVLIGLAAIFCVLPAICGFLLSLAFFSLIAGPLIVLGLIGFLLIAISIRNNNENTTGKKMVSTAKAPKPVTITWRGKKIPLGIFIYSIVSSLIIAPILIIALFLFTPEIIAIPLIFITIGIEIGRWSKK